MKAGSQPPPKSGRWETHQAGHLGSGFGGRSLGAGSWGAGGGGVGGEERDLTQWAGLEADLLAGCVAHAHTCWRRQIQ